VPAGAHVPEANERHGTIVEAVVDLRGAADGCQGDAVRCQGDTGGHAVDEHQAGLVADPRRELVLLLARGCIEHAHGTVEIVHRHALAVRGERHSAGAADELCKVHIGKFRRGKLLARGDVPDLELVVRRAEGRPLAVGRQREPAGPGRQTEGSDLLAASHLPLA
jgi:hypothetical protein